jgi:penicillin-binding protein 2
MQQPLRRFRPAVPSAPPVPENRAPLGRLRFFALSLVVFFGLLVGRIWYLQVMKGDDFHEQALANRLSPVRTPAPRGLITDCKGRVLVTNGPQFTVFVSPSDLPKDHGEQEALFSRLADVLRIPRQQLDRILTRGKRGSSDPIAVAEGVDDHTLTRIAERHHLLPAVIARVEPVRKYPQGTLAAHLLGYIGQISDTELQNPRNARLGYQGGDFIGKSGVECQYDSYLNGRPGQLQYQVDSRGRRQTLLGELPPQSGATLRLGLDLDVQRACEQALAGKRGAAVALDPRDGHVISLASYPNFDPNLLAHRPLLRQVYESQIAPGLFDRATQFAGPPGSTFKIVTSAAALATGAETATSIETCTGGFMIGKHEKHCDGVHGSLTLPMALERSCDVYYYHAGLKAGPTALADWASHFGLGHRSGIDLPSGTETGGTIPSPAWKRIMAPKFHNPDTTWYPGETANMAIGQGEVQASPIQICQLSEAIANHGTIYAPHVVLSATDSMTGAILYQAKPTVVRTIPLKPEQLALISEGMWRVVHGSHGTSNAANLAGVDVAGKSGSAERRTGATHNPLDAWFTCFAPVEHPTIAICVYLESGGANLHGGVDAAPIARAMLAAYFHVPDRVAPVGRGD